MMDLSPWERTLFVTAVYAVILTFAKLMPMITQDVSKTLDVLTAKPTVPARIVFPTLTAELSMVVRPLDNLVVILPLVFVVLARLTPTALPLPPTAVLMEVAMLVLHVRPTCNAEAKMEVKSPINKTVILSPTSV